MKITAFENRYASDNDAVKAKAAAKGQRVANTLHQDIEWEGFVEGVINKDSWKIFTATDKTSYDRCKQGFDGFVFGEMQLGKPRSSGNVVAFHAIVLDIDGGATVSEVQEDLRQYEYVMYSSGGTGIKEGDRFRVVMPLHSPLAPYEWKYYASSLNERFPYSDQSFSKSLQIQYFPMLNTVHADKFIAHHNVGKWIDPINDIPYVESLSLETVVSTTTWSDLDFTSDEMGELAQAITEHCGNQLGYEDRRILANRLKLIGMDWFTSKTVLDAVARPGATNISEQIWNGADAAYARVEGLYKNVAKGIRIPAIERRMVRTVQVLSHSQVDPRYDGDWTLTEDEYLSDYVDLMDFSTGVSLLISSVGTGKTKFWSSRNNIKFVAPLTSIIESISDTNNLTQGNVGTWNQIESIINAKDKSIFKDMTLVIDEAHGLICDYSYKNNIINRLMSAFNAFRSVVLMSGTVEAEYFSSINFSKVYRLRKPSKAKKNLYPSFCTNKDAAVINHINKLTNKTIVLVNDKKLCKMMQNRIDRRSLIVNADVKDTDEVSQFFKSGQMNDYEVIIGTNSIVEGLSIEDELDSIDVVIWDDLDPDRIEQFTNRFRNVSTAKNVWYFVDKRTVEEIDEYSRDAVVDDAKVLCESLQRGYDRIQTEALRRSFIMQFSGDMAQDMVYFRHGKFYVSSTSVDYDYFCYRALLSRNDFSVFSQCLQVFGFDVFFPRMEDGDVQSAEQIREEKRIIAETNKKERAMKLDALSADIQNNCVQLGQYGDLYDSTHGSVQKLVAKGMAWKDAPAVIENYKQNEAFFALCHADADFIPTGTTIRELISDEAQKVLHKGGFITSADANRIANLVVQRVAVEYAGGTERLLKTRSWASDVEKCNAPLSNDLNNRNDQALHIQVKQNRSRAVLNRYVRIGKSCTQRIGGKVESGYCIEALSRTGILFSQQNSYMTPPNLAIEALKDKVKKLRSG
ncbi:TPA: hypothetical protein ACPZRY_004506 [Yersinia enterocolitica]|uniref:hypothetical protein n=1 Tax=Yersinia TaxID=629 RepID=UPI001D1208D7|nr:hypothetical protein [Yersinia proxima]EKN3724664.1 hypothetical protein [Yersinia enterocolitica]EKN4808790.1 hypothetical protein [Yersinia enterocolitica]HDL7328500.1 hypothetical protein [Yersinia enterocolitica]HDL7355967.1 hypothetical protein [Yersinia enterocolitica]HDL7957308.1 hypothetical protein [Yersinia enterocolitica]